MTGSFEATDRPADEVLDALAAGEAFSELFRRSRHAMLLADDERRYLAANDAASALLGLPRESIVGRTIDEFTPPETRSAIDAQWRDFISRGTQDGRYELLLADGRPVELTFSATANIAPGVHVSMLMAVDEEERSEAGSGAVPRAASEDGKATRISPREVQVLRLVALGGSNAEIAEQLGISSETVRNHVRGARGKLGARTKAHAVALAIEGGLFESSAEAGAHRQDHDRLGS